jgi:phage gpG-like protein
MGIAEVEGQTLREAIAGLQRFEKRTGDMTPAWKALVPYLDQIVSHRFRTGDNGRWPARKAFYPWPILDRTGKLKRSIVYKIKPQKITQSTRGVKYAWYHQIGSGYKRYITATAARALETLAGTKRYTFGRKNRDEILLEDGRLYKVSRQKKAGTREQAGRGGLPRRPILFLEDADLTEIREVLVEYLDGAFHTGEVTDAAR